MVTIQDGGKCALRFLVVTDDVVRPSLIFQPFTNAQARVTLET